MSIRKNYIKTQNIIKEDILGGLGYDMLLSKLHL